MSTFYQLVILASCFLYLFFSGCSQESADSGFSQSRETSSAYSKDIAKIVSPFDLGWNPATGKGRVTQLFPNGDRISICFQCRYPGYAGGLWLGSMNGSGFMLIKAKPSNSFPRLNIFCAQDESLIDESSGIEYDSGWSENFGSGNDGIRLEYTGEGEIIEDGTKGNLILKSVNKGGGYEMTRYLLWPTGKTWIIISVYIRNLSEVEKRFSFWTGDDPWIGTYKSSNGDVGWYSGGIVRTEMEIDGKLFGCGGLYDLGNKLLGQSNKPFSKVANVICPSPVLPPPDRVYFANSFAHKKTDINPQRPLDNKSLTAINLGWEQIRLAPNEVKHFAYLLGQATTGKIGETPTPPKVPETMWAFDNASISASREAEKDGKSSINLLPVQFKSENIRMHVDPPQLNVRAEYVLYNRLPVAQTINLLYPFPLDEGNKFPHRYKVEGAKYKKTKTGLILRVNLKPKSEHKIFVEYDQNFKGRQAHYILKTTLRWGEVLEEALYEVRWPTTLKGGIVSIKGNQHVEGKWVIFKTIKNNFLPTKDLILYVVSESGRDWGDFLKETLLRISCFYLHVLRQVVSVHFFPVFKCFTFQFIPSF